MGNATDTTPRGQAAASFQPAQGGDASDPSAEQPSGMSDAVSGAMQQAAGQVQHVREKATGQLRQRMGDQLGQASQQADAVAQALRQAQTQLQEQGQDQAAGLVGRGIGATERIASYLQSADADRILADVEDLGRRQPLLMAAGGLVAGFAASRFLKASSQRRLERRSSSQDGERSSSKQNPRQNQGQNQGWWGAGQPGWSVEAGTPGWNAVQEPAWTPPPVTGPVTVDLTGNDPAADWVTAPAADPWVSESSMSDTGVSTAVTETLPRSGGSGSGGGDSATGGPRRATGRRGGNAGSGTSGGGGSAKRHGTQGGRGTDASA